MTSNRASHRALFHAASEAFDETAKVLGVGLDGEARHIHLREHLLILEEKLREKGFRVNLVQFLEETVS